MPECESCERLKQLVFQAKEAIDDLKLEIEEWREVSSDKERELRQIYHRLYNDLIGINKQVQFDETVQLKEFDGNRPVNTEVNRIKNYIKHNKQRIIPRSKHQTPSKATGQTQSHKNTTASGKKSCVKRIACNLLDNEGDDAREFFVAEDRAVQTSPPSKENSQVIASPESQSRQLTSFNATNSTQSAKIQSNNNYTNGT